jgi:phage terminase large subunit
MITWTKKHEDALHLLAVDSPVELVLYGGAAGSGKSFLGCAWQIWRRIKYPGTRGLIGRSKLDTLKKTTLRTFFEVASMHNLRSGEHYTYNGQSNIISFFNGSEIVLKDLFAYPSDPNFDSLGSLEITDWFIDEVSQVSKKAVDIVRSRVRFKLREFSIPPKGLMTCNPSKGWLYNEIYAPYKQDALPAHVAFIPALPGDNPHLPDTYLETLARLPEMDRKRLLEGDWEYDESNDWLFKPDDVLRCFRESPLTGDMYITADVARFGKDRSVICLWQGLTLIGITEFRKQPITTIVQHIRQLCELKAVKLTNVLVDEDGVGGGVVDALQCRGFQNGSRAKHPETYSNLKAECYFKLAEFMEYNKLFMRTANQRDVIVKELDMIRRRNPDADGKLSVSSKDEIQRMHGVSPDYADAIMMRMYFELFPNYGNYSWV